MKNNKMLKVLSTTALAASLIVPVAAPAFAATENRANYVSISDDSEKVTVGEVTLREEEGYQNDLKAGRTFTLSLPAGVEFANAYDDASKVYTDLVEIDGQDVDAKRISDRLVEVTLPSATDLGDDAAAPDNSKRNTIRITPIITLDGFSGSDVQLEVEGNNSGVTSGSYTIAKVAGSGETKAVIDSVKTIGDAKTTIEPIRISENSLESLGKDKQRVTLKLKNGFEWSSANVELAGGFSGLAISKEEISSDKRTLTIEFTPDTNRNQRGYILVTPTIEANDDARQDGDVTVEIKGQNLASNGDGKRVTNETLVVAKYGDYGVTVKANGDIKDVYSGKKDQEFTELVISEKLANSILKDRKTTVELPNWVKITSVDVNTKNIKIDNINVDSSKNKFDVIRNTEGSGTSTGEIKLKIEGSIEAGNTGDVEATIKGNAGVEGKAVIGKAISPVTVTASEAKPVKIGLTDQAIADITIVETKKEAINDETNKKEIEVTLPENSKWTSDPKVTVTDGDLVLDERNIETDGRILTIPVKSASSKPSTIKITEGKVTLDRNLPEGSFKVKVGGTAIVDNYEKDAKTSTPVTFDTSNVVSVLAANVVTPAPGETTAQNIVFKIGQKSYTVNGVTKEIDVAPYVHPVYNRTYVPVAHFAASLNVAPEKVVWNEAAKTVTVFSGSTVVTATAGKKEIVVNGTAIPTDAPVMYGQHTGYRVLVPYTHLAVALGAKVEWKADTQEIIVNK